MGSHSIERVWPGTLTPAQVRAKFDELLSNDRHEHGHGGYSGSWGTMTGVTIKDTVFDTEKDALEFCLDNTRKWENALAVRFHRITKTPKKSPTFGDKAPGDGNYAPGTEPIYTVVYANGTRKRIWADQLSPRQVDSASKVLAAYDALLAEVREISTRMNDFARALTTPGEIDFAALRATRKDYLRASAKCQAAKTRWETLEASLRPKLWEFTETKDLCWLVAGWAAS